MTLGATTPLMRRGDKSIDYSAKQEPYGTPLSTSPENPVTHRIPKRAAFREENMAPTEVKAKCLDM